MSVKMNRARNRMGIKEEEKKGGRHRERERR